MLNQSRKSLVKDKENTQNIAQHRVTRLVREKEDKVNSFMEKTNSNMNLLASLGRNLKNIFVGSHRGEDFVLENLEKSDKKETKVPEKTNDMGVNPDEWFDDHYMPELGEPPSWEDTAPSEYEPPEEEITMHEKMYRMATARYNPFSLGGSENCDSDVSCTNLGGGSEEIQK